MEEENLPEIPDTPDTNNKKQKVIKIVAAIIFAFASIIFLIDRLFTDFEPSTPMNPNPVEEPKENYYEGTIKYIPSTEYPEENINFALLNQEGKRIILLRSEDEKLEVAENLDVKVSGLKTKTEDGEEVLMVEEVIISN